MLRMRVNERLGDYIPDQQRRREKQQRITIDFECTRSIASTTDPAVLRQRQHRVDR